MAPKVFVISIALIWTGILYISVKTNVTWNLKTMKCAPLWLYRQRTTLHSQNAWSFPLQKLLRWLKIYSTLAASELTLSALRECVDVSGDFWMEAKTLEKNYCIKFAISKIDIKFALITPPHSLCTMDLLLLGAFFLYIWKNLKHPKRLSFTSTASIFITDLKLIR